VVEILSPRDETWDKLPFYADHRVDELIIVDPATSSIDWRALHDGKYVAVDKSALLDLDRDRLAEQIDWPPTDQ